MNTTTLKDLLDDYLEHRSSLRASKKTLETIWYSCRPFITWLHDAYGIATADRLQEKHLIAWVRHASTRLTEKGEPLQSSSVNSQIQAARVFLRYLSSTGYVRKDLCDSLQYVKEPKSLPTSVLTHAEARKLLSMIPTDTARGYMNRALLELMYSSGLRACEVLRIDVEDLDLANGTALVNGKGDKQRVVPVGRTAVRYLESYVKAARPCMVQDDENALFLNNRGRRLGYDTLLDLVHQIADLVGIEINVTPHTFRRSCTTELIRGDANVYHVKDMLGHESLDTLDHYAKLTIVDLKKTHDKCHPRERDGG